MSFTLYKKLCPDGLKTNANRPMKSISFISIHNTGNYAAGANAKMHADYQCNGAGGRQASWHYSVDEKEVWQSFPDDRECWHCGDGSGPGNTSSIGIEICVNSQAGFPQACLNAAELTATLLKRHNLPIERVVQHNKWSGKNCPEELRSGRWGVTWENFISMVGKELVPVSASEKVLRLLDATGKTYDRAHWKKVLDGVEPANPEWLGILLERILS